MKALIIITSMLLFLPVTAHAGKNFNWRIVYDVSGTAKKIDVKKESGIIENNTEGYVCKYLLEEVEEKNVDIEKLTVYCISAPTVTLAAVKSHAICAKTGKAYREVYNELEMGTPNKLTTISITATKK